jgi:hypothetical protein
MSLETGESRASKKILYGKHLKGFRTDKYGLKNSITSSPEGKSKSLLHRANSILCVWKYLKEFIVSQRF